jgi:hypothetical protein
MPNRVDAPVDPMQAPRPEPTEDRVAAEARLSQLHSRDHSVLAPTYLGDPQIGSGAFFGHMPNKAPLPVLSPY